MGSMGLNITCWKGLAVICKQTDLKAFGLLDGAILHINCILFSDIIQIQSSFEQGIFLEIFYVMQII